MWQPYYVRERISSGSGSAGGIKSGILTTRLIPGLSTPGEVDANEAFKDDHVLERVRGTMVHDASPSTNVSQRPTQFPFTFAAMRIPRGLNISADDIDLFDPEEGSDFFIYHSGICDVQGTLTPELEQVDNKAKRKFGVGDAVAFLWSLITPGSTSVDVDLVLNLRFLWKLKI